MKIIYQTRDGLTSIVEKGMTDITPRIRRPVSHRLSAQVCYEELPDDTRVFDYREYEYRGQLGDFYLYVEK